jgi:hypothetical protein
MKILAFVLAIVLFITYWAILYGVSGTPNFSAQSPPGTSTSRQIGNFFLVLIAYTSLAVSILCFIIGCISGVVSGGFTSVGRATGFTSAVPVGGSRKKGRTK